MQNTTEGNMILTNQSSQQDTETGYTIQQLRMNFATATVMQSKGIDTVCRWDSNGRIPFEDMLNDFRDLGLISQQVVTNSLATREIEDRAFLKEYVEAQKNRSPEAIAEERAEARAAHGVGVKLVNVFSGETYTT